MVRVDPRLIPTDVEDLTPRWLAEIAGEAPASLGTTSIASTSFSYVVELRSESQSWMVKWSRTDRAHPELEKGHEILFYEQLAPSLPREVLAPAVAWAHDPVRPAVMVVFSSLPDHTRPRPSHLPPSLSTCQKMIDTLATIHAARWSNPPLDVLGLTLPDDREIENRVNIAKDRVARLANRLETALGPDVLRTLHRVVEQLPRVLSRLTDPVGMSLVHDDVHIGNFLLPTGDGPARLIDWQTWIPDLAARDLAHMIAYFWFPSPRRELETPLLRLYHRRLASKGVDYTWDALWRDYRLSVVRSVLHAVWEWDIGADEWKWYSHLMRITQAYSDLACDEL